VRLESGAPSRVRVFSAECPIDAGGATVHWLNGVRPADSVAVLAALVSGTDGNRAARRVGDGALAAIAHHADPAAITALDGLLAPGRPPWVREQAAFWMGQTGGTRALDTLIRLAGQDADDHFREHLAFVLSQSAEPRALEALIGMAKRDASRKVRGQALFWLGQKAEKKALAAIEDAIREDPDTDIKKKAVFALSQLPKDEGVPLLIRTARSHSNREVRKQAMFWLGQSEDPRALAFFEEVLTH
jgi:HEAT repeat protein